MPSGADAFTSDQNSSQGTHKILFRVSFLINLISTNITTVLINIAYYIIILPIYQVKSTGNVFTQSSLTFVIEVFVIGQGGTIEPQQLCVWIHYCRFGKSKTGDEINYQLKCCPNMFYS